MKWGAIIGDIIGSRFEGCQLARVPFEYFVEERSCFTDDSVCTLAVAEAILDHKEKGVSLEQSAIKQLQKKGRRYLWAGFGGGMYTWIMADNPAPYGSYGNGAAMRVSPCAWLADSYEQAIEYAHTVTNITHNHEDSIWGAEVTVTAIWYLSQTDDKEYVMELLHDRYGLDLEKVQNNPFQINCRDAVSLACKAFFEANSFEETIQNAVWLGGDTDTIAAIAGSIAEAYYEVPPEWIEKAKERFAECKNDFQAFERWQ